MLLDVCGCSHACYDGVPINGEALFVAHRRMLYDPEDGKVFRIFIEVKERMNLRPANAYEAAVWDLLTFYVWPKDFCRKHGLTYSARMRSEHERIADELRARAEHPLGPRANSRPYIAHLRRIGELFWSREDAIDAGGEGYRVPGEWLQLAEVKLESVDKARIGEALLVVDEWLREDGRSLFMDKMPRKAKALRLQYVERGRDLRKLRKQMKTGVVGLGNALRKKGFGDVIVRGPDWQSDYFQGDLRLEKYIPLAPSEDLTEPHPTRTHIRPTQRDCHLAVGHM